VSEDLSQKGIDLESPTGHRQLVAMFSHFRESYNASAVLVRQIMLNFPLSNPQLLFIRLY
jgi:hypothetical protein